MSIRLKTIIASTLALAALIAVLDVAMLFAVKRTFGAMETREAKKSIEHGTTIVKGVVQSVEKAIYDWAVWDDTYQFIQDRNPDFVSSNLTSGTIAGMRLNIMFYYDKQGKLVMGKAVNTETAEEEPLPKDLLAMLKSDPRFLNHSTPDSSISGIALTNHGPIALCAHAITTSDEKSKPIGTLVFGRYISNVLVSDLSREYGLSLGVYTLSGKTLPADFARAAGMMRGNQNTMPIIPLSEDRIASYSSVNDVFGKPALVVRVDSPREIHEQSLAMVRYTTFGLIIAGLIFAAANVIWLDIAVLRRIVRLDGFVRGVMNELGLTQTPTSPSA